MEEMVRLIRDLEKALATGQRMVKNNVPVPDDAEATALRQRRDELRAIYDEVFAKPDLTDGQRLNIALKTAQRSASDWEHRLKDAQAGVWKGPKKPGKPLPASAELDAVKAQRDAAKAEGPTRLSQVRHSQGERFARFADAIGGDMKTLAKGQEDRSYRQRQQNRSTGGSQAVALSCYGYVWLCI